MVRLPYASRQSSVSNSQPIRQVYAEFGPSHPYRLEIRRSWLLRHAVAPPCVQRILDADHSARQRCHFLPGSRLHESRISTRHDNLKILPRRACLYSALDARSPEYRGHTRCHAGLFRNADGRDRRLRARRARPCRLRLHPPLYGRQWSDRPAARADATRNRCYEGPMRSILLVCLAILLASALFLLWPGLDLVVAALFYRGHGDFLLDGNAVTTAIHEAVPAMMELAGAAIVLLLG